jgi:hypothetical protein
VSSRESNEVARLNRRISELEQVVAGLAGRPGASEDEPGAVRDARWKCRKCAALLAFYDQTDDVLRIRYKEHLTYVHVGEGGWVQIVCKGCGEPNLQAYATQEEVDAAQRESGKGGRPSGKGGVMG